MTAHERLAAELGRMLAAGRWPRCCAEGDRGGWLSDDRDERARAAALCAGCPLLEPCREVGEGERFGVFGGRDVTPTARSKRTHTHETGHRQ